MRSQKQVRRVGKVRSLKNAAAGKWKIYRKCLEARKAWQNNAILTGHHHSSNTLVPPKPTRRRMKEPKQRSAEELAERQRLRKQRHLEKKLAKQRASTSTLPETRKKKKLEEGFGSGSPKKASAGHKTTTKTIKAKNSMMKDTRKAKRLMNEQVQRAVNMVEQEIAAIKLNKLKAMKVPKLRTESIPKRQYLMSTQEQEINQSSSTKLGQKELVQSKKTANGGEQNDIHGSAGRVKGTSKEQMRKKNRRSDPNLLEHDFVGIRKQEGNVSEKEKIKELNKSIVYLAMDQNCTEESKEFKAEKIMDHIMFSSGKIPKHSETLWKTKMAMKTSFPKELDINMGKLAQQYSEPLGGPNLSLSGNGSESMTAISCVKEAKYDMDAEKKSVLISQTDEVNRVPPVRDRICKLLPRDIQFCVHMIEKHGEDYEAMEKDQGNIFRDSAKGIARKIRIFKESPQYEAYLKKQIESFGSVA